MNYEELNKVVEESGMKKTAIAQGIGMTPQAFCDCLSGRRQFKAREALLFARLLHLTAKQLGDIFLP